MTEGNRRHGNGFLPNRSRRFYRKRFGLKAEHVRAIMDGQAGKDGTYFDAQAAVKAGIIPAEHVIHTSKQLCRKVHDEIED